jgi:hypothetical protein
LRGIIRKIALNPAYIGKRVLRGEVVGEGMWPALVTEETFWACARLLGDPARTTTRAGRAVHLLSYIARCGVCGGPLSVGTVNRHGWQGQVYSCLKRRCAAVKVRGARRVCPTGCGGLVVPRGRLPGPHQRGSDEQATHARSEAQRLRAELEDWRKLAETGEVTAISFARAEKGLLTAITAAEQTALDAAIPPVLRGRIGEHAMATWQGLGESSRSNGSHPCCRRHRTLPAGKGRRAFTPDRIRWTWKLGPITREQHRRRSRRCCYSIRAGHRSDVVTGVYGD